MIISGLQKVSLSDFPGIPSCIIFTQGCNFKCPFCHNGDLIPMGDSRTEQPHHQEIKDFLTKRAGKLEGVVFTGGEPLLHKDLDEWMSFARSLGYKIKLDTNGYSPKLLKNLLDKVEVDYIAMDVKAPWDKYAILAGRSVDFEKIKSSMDVIISSGVKHEFRTTYVKDLLSDEDIEAIKSNLKESYLHLGVEPIELKVQAFKPENALDKTLTQ